MQPRVYIIVLNWNGWRQTLECLESIQRLNYENYRIIVVDNGSGDNSVSFLETWSSGCYIVNSPYFKWDQSSKPLYLVKYDRITAEAGGLPNLEKKIEGLPSSKVLVLIETGANLGYAGGNNVAIRYVLKRGGDYAWILNNDTVVESNSLSEMVKTAETDSQIGMVGCKLLYYNRPNVIQAAGGGKFNFWLGISRHYGSLDQDNGKWDRNFEPFYITGASLLVRVRAIEEVGEMDETYFLYGEEVDWQIRARRLGWRSGYAPKGRVYHKEGASSGYKSSYAEYLITRNSIRLCRRYTPWTVPSAVLSNYLRALRRMVQGQPGCATAILRGMHEGLRDKVWGK